MTEQIVGIPLGVRRPPVWWSLAALAFVALSVGCGGSRPTGIPPNIGQPDRFLMDRGNESLKDRRWVNAREYFRQLVDSYPQSPLRPEAKLGIGDSYLGEGSMESRLMAATEFREFLTFYPTNPRADYAQYRLAMTYYEQMRDPGRDQTETKQALQEFDAFFQRYPNSPLIPEVKTKWREARDRLSESSFRVGVQYYRMRWFPGAIDRFREVLRDDPGFSRQDAVLFHLAESLARTDNKAEAIPYYERLVEEFEQSEHLTEARRRLQELQAQ
jgi:outer membrane protein assembly factor BamD